MKKIKTKFKDLFVVNTRVFKDKRGWLKEEFKKNFIKKNLVFTLVSSSKKNVLRGLHMQTKKPQDKFLSVLKGKVLDVVVDLRKSSKTYEMPTMVVKTRVVCAELLNNTMCILFRGGLT